MKKLVLLGALLGVVGLFSFATPVNEPTPASISPYLIFPVAHKKAYVGSFWGAVRDGGKRKHEGIDIFAKKGTPVVAVSDGLVVAVTNAPRGGKTVWLRSEDYGWTEYYAHLHEQKVKRGQRVTKGQVIGTVGNTGNAKLTPPHLHFGIYTARGAVNPFPYVKNSPRLSIPASSLKKEALVKAPKNNAPPKAARPEKLPIASQYIWKRIDIPADANGKYFVTIRKNVVRTQGQQLHVVGKWTNGNSNKYPYRIQLLNKKSFLVTSSGKVVTPAGTAVGTVI